MMVVFGFLHCNLTKQLYCCMKLNNKMMYNMPFGITLWICRNSIVRKATLVLSSMSTPFWTLIWPLNFCNYENPCHKGHAYHVWSKLAPNLEMLKRWKLYNRQTTERLRSQYSTWAFGSGDLIITILNSYKRDPVLNERF